MKDAAKYVDVDSLIPWEENPRLNEGAVLNVMASIKEFGFASPIIARLETGQIIAGHTRWKAAKELGLEMVPVRFMDISEAKAKQLAIADNKIGELAIWDDAKLAGVLSDIQEEIEGFDFSALGFGEDEVNALLTNWEDVLANEVGLDEEQHLEDEADEGVAKIVVEVPIVASHEASAAIRVGLNDGGFADKDFKLRVV